MPEPACLLLKHFVSEPKKKKRRKNGDQFSFMNNVPRLHIGPNEIEGSHRKIYFATLALHLNTSILLSVTSTIL